MPIYTRRFECAYLLHPTRHTWRKYLKKCERDKIPVNKNASRSGAILANENPLMGNSRVYIAWMNYALIILIWQATPQVLRMVGSGQIVDEKHKSNPLPAPQGHRSPMSSRLRHQDPCEKLEGNQIWTLRDKSARNQTCCPLYGYDSANTTEIIIRNLFESWKNLIRWLQGLDWKYSIHLDGLTQKLWANQTFEKDPRILLYLRQWSWLDWPTREVEGLLSGHINVKVSKLMTPENTRKWISLLKIFGEHPNGVRNFKANLFSRKY